MEKIINKYKDEFGYISDLMALYKDLYENKVSLNEISDILKNVSLENEKVRKKLELENIKLKNIISNKENIVDIEYQKSVKKQPPIQISKPKEKIDITFYIQYIETHKSDKIYLDMLPINNDNESLKIIDSILAHYLKEINTIKYFLAMEKEEKEIENMIENVNIYNEIFEEIKKYKESLLYTAPEEKNNLKNEILYYMNGNISYIYSDIVDSPNSYESIKSLLNSIENGTFKNIKQFTNNDKFKGLLEVRDLKNTTRVFFVPLGNKKYCVIYAITEKKETNLLYKQRLYLRYKRYCDEKNNIKTSEDVEDIKKLLLRGE